MADFDLEAVAARHQPHRSRDGSPIFPFRCRECNQLWGEDGCDAAQLVDALRERDDEIRRLRSVVDGAVADAVSRGGSVRVRGETP